MSQPSNQPTNDQSPMRPTPSDQVVSDNRLSPALPGQVRMRDAVADLDLEPWTVATFADLSPDQWWRECPSVAAMVALLPAGQLDSPLRRRLVGLAAAIARRALPIFESDFPDDRRPRAAIETAQRFADGRDVRNQELRRAADDAVSAYDAAGSSAAGLAAAAAFAAAFADDDAQAVFAAQAAGSAQDAGVPSAELCALVRQHYPEGVWWVIRQRRDQPTRRPR